MEVHSLCLCRTVSEDVVHLGSLVFRQGLGRFLAAVYSVWRRHSKSKLQHSRWLAGGCSEQETLVRGERRRGVLQAKSSLHWKENIDKEHTRRQRMTNSGEILPVEVKKSSRKREKDVCPKHIYLLEKKDSEARLAAGTSFWNDSLSNSSITARRDQNSALTRVAWKEKIVFFFFFKKK